MGEWTLGTSPAWQHVQRHRSQRTTFSGAQFHPERSAGRRRRVCCARIHGDDFCHEYSDHPAIDLLDGSCVRLLHGEFEQCKVYELDAAQAGRNAYAA